MNKQTKHSPNPNASGGKLARGQRMNPPQGAQIPSKGKASKQTRNSPSNKA